MSLLRRADEQTQSEWLPVAEGLWRWLVGVPELKLSEKFGNYQVRFPLQLKSEEQSRLLTEVGKPPEGMQQSWRTSYTVGLSLGYVRRDGQYKSTKLVDFLAACLGAGNTKKFREWIAQGGGPSTTGVGGAGGGVQACVIGYCASTTANRCSRRVSSVSRSVSWHWRPAMVT